VQNYSNTEAWGQVAVRGTEMVGRGGGTQMADKNRRHFEGHPGKNKNLKCGKKRRSWPQNQGGVKAERGMEEKGKKKTTWDSYALEDGMSLKNCQRQRSMIKLIR